MPDERHLTIRYTAEVLGPVGATVKVSNNAYFKGQMNADPAGIEENVVVMRGAGQSFSDRMIWLDKRDGNGERLARAGFGLYKYKDGKWAKASNINIDEADDTKVPGLEERVLYKLVEEKAPSGYVRDDTPRYFVLRESAEETFEKPDDLEESEIRSMLIAGTMTIYNAPSHKVTFEKVDAEGKNLADAQFAVQTADGKPAWDAHKTEKITFTSGKDPVSYDMAAGSYLLTETKAPAGYVLADPLPFTVGDDGTITMGEETCETVRAVNHLTRLSFIKMDHRHNVPLAGAVLEILDKDGKSAHKWTSTKEAEIVTGLHTGEQYTLHEISAPAGFRLAKDIPFTISEKGEVEIDADLYDSSIRIENIYEAEGGVTLHATKTLTGQKLEEGLFTFELKDAIGKR